MHAWIQKGVPPKKIHWLHVTYQIKIVKFLHICLGPPPQKKNSGSAHAMHYFFLITCFHDNCGIIHVAYIYKICSGVVVFFCNQIDRLKFFFNLFFFKLKRHEKISINKEFQFNVHISCLLNTAKERYLVDSYLQTHRPHPINKINFNISFFEHKQYKIYSDINRSPCVSTLFGIHVNFANNIYGTFSKFSLFWRISLCVYLTHRYQIQMFIAHLERCPLNCQS